MPKLKHDRKSGVSTQEVKGASQQARLARVVEYATSSRIDLDREQLRIARNLARKGAGLEEIAKEIEWIGKPQTLKRKLKAVNIHVGKFKTWLRGVEVRR